MRTPELLPAVALALAIACAASAQEAEEPDPPVTTDRPTHQESARTHDSTPDPDFETPPLPEGMTLDEVLERAAQPPPEHFPDPVPDDRILVFTFFEQLEYRLPSDDGRGHAGWEVQGWIGGNFQKFWWKNEGEARFQGIDEGETETDLLYSRLFTPFWNLQAGVQYAGEWGGDEYEDRWSAVVGLQGLAPYKFELDPSLYLSTDGDFTLEFEGEYDLRITQRLVAQPRTELGIAFQDIEDRGMGAGLTSVVADLRLRYEYRRELAPYLGIRGSWLVGETADLAEAAGGDTSDLLYLAGLRFAF